MKIYSKISDLKLDKQSVVTIGTFDGLHLGHKKIVARLNEIAKNTNLETLVFTFEPHPRSILFPDQKDLRILTTRFEKQILLRGLGIQHLLEFPFTKEFAQIEPEAYVKDILLGKLNMKHLVIGYDHKFGQNRRGNIDLLHKMSAEYGFVVEEIPVQEIDQLNISSTRIRKALEDGNLTQANAYLGYNYFLRGTVVEGKKLGRQLGFPTANLEVESEFKLVPKNGVYVVEVEIEDEKFGGMMSIGINPTTDIDKKIKIEVNIFEFNGDLYNKQIQINVLEYIRPELKFENLDLLIKEIQNDKIKALNILAKHT